MSIRMVLLRITSAQYERLVAGDADLSQWNMDDQDERLDKSWYVLYQLLVNGETGNPPRVAKAISGDVLIAHEDLPYGPPCGEILRTMTLPDGSQELLPVAGMGALSAELVRHIANDLAAIDDEDLRHRAICRPIRRSHGGLIHPDDIDNYVQHFHELREFYEASAGAGVAVALWVG